MYIPIWKWDYLLNIQKYRGKKLKNPFHNIYLIAYFGYYSLSQLPFKLNVIFEVGLYDRLLIYSKCCFTHNISFRHFIRLKKGFLVMCIYYITCVGSISTVISFWSKKRQFFRQNSGKTPLKEVYLLNLYSWYLARLTQSYLVDQLNVFISWQGPKAWRHCLSYS